MSIYARLCAQALSEPLLRCTCNTTAPIDPTSVATISFALGSFFIYLTFTQESYKSTFLPSALCNQFVDRSCEFVDDVAFINENLNYDANKITNAVNLSLVDVLMAGATSANGLDLYIDKAKGYAYMGNLTRSVYYCVPIPGIVSSLSQDCLVTDSAVFAFDFYNAGPLVNNISYERVRPQPGVRLYALGSKLTFSTQFLDFWPDHPGNPINIDPFGPSTAAFSGLPPLRALIPFQFNIPLTQSIDPITNRTVTTLYRANGQSYTLDSESQATIDLSAATIVDSRRLQNDYDIIASHATTSLTYAKIALDATVARATLNKIFYDKNLTCLELRASEPTMQNIDDSTWAFLNTIWSQPADAVNAWTKSLNLTVEAITALDDRLTAALEELSRENAILDGLYAAITSIKMDYQALSDAYGRACRDNDQITAYLNTFDIVYRNNLAVADELKRAEKSLVATNIALGVRGTAMYLDAIAEFGAQYLSYADNTVTTAFAAAGVDLNANTVLVNGSSTSMVAGTPVATPNGTPIKVPYSADQRFAQSEPTSTGCFWVNLIFSVICSAVVVGVGHCFLPCLK